MRPLSALAAGSIVLSLAMAGGVAAGDNNELYVIQKSPVGTLSGNTLEVDQSAASGSLVRGLNANLIGPFPAFLLSKAGVDPQFALQRGENNAAKLTLTGAGGELQLLQSSNPLAIWAPGLATANNTATVTADTNALGGVAQIGTNNTATVDLGLSAQGLVVQLGSQLTTNLQVEQGGTGQVIQIGTNNNTGLVTVPVGGNVTVELIGNNIAPAGQGGVQVLSTSNPGNITITQTPW